MHYNRKPHLLLFLWPTLLLIPLLAFHQTLDLKVSDFFWAYYPRFEVGAFWKFIYHWAVVPSLLVGFISLSLLILQISPKWQKYRTGALMAFLTLLIGPGFLINTTLKGYWQRPRPIQIERYQGTEVYAPINKIRLASERNKHQSFPSGHASMGFYFLCLWRIAERENKRKWSKRCLIAACILTALLSWARLAKGGHFISDIMISGYIVWLVTLALESYCYGKQNNELIQLQDESDF
jgi:lipid A 4'-phosphatase